MTGLQGKLDKVERQLDQTPDNPRLLKRWYTLREQIGVDLLKRHIAWNQELAELPEYERQEVVRAIKNTMLAWDSTVRALRHIQSELTSASRVSPGASHALRSLEGRLELDIMNATVALKQTETWGADHAEYLKLARDASARA